jgi:hypothetical protein
MLTLIRRKLPLFLLLLFVISTSGCSSIERLEQTYNNNLVSLNQENTIGQTFVARFDGLNGISIYLVPDNWGDGNLILSLYSDPSDHVEIINPSILPLSNINSPGYYKFSFSEQEKSTNNYYYINIEVIGDGNVKLGTGAGSTYLNGALYNDRSPQDAQMTFKLSYAPSLLGLGLINEIGIWLLFILIGLWLFLIPGWALLSLVLPGWRTSSWLVRVGFSAGVSLAAYPVLFLWTDLLGLHLGVLYAWLLPALGLMVILMNTFRRIKNSEDWTNLVAEQKTTIIRYFRSPLLVFPNLVLLLIILLIIFTRFWVVRNLDGPMWGDSYQHTMMAQLLVDNNGLFNSWEPYVELVTFTYHFGFHSLVAVFHWITKLSLPQATLWSGQIINVLAVISLYPLALRIGNNHWAGIVTILLAGLLLPLPMFYVNWGRYTQLAGQVILASLVYLTWQYLDSKSNHFRFSLLVSVLFGGLALTHYRVLSFAVLLIPVYYLLFSHKIYSREFFIRVILIVLISVLIILPWIFQLSGGDLPEILIAQVSPGNNRPVDFAQQYSEIAHLISYLPIIFWLVTPLLIFWGLWRRDKNVLFISLWWFFIFLAANPQWLRLPGAGVITNFAVFIAAYFPISLIIGASVGLIIAKIDIRRLSDTTRLRSIPTSTIKSSSIVVMLITVITLSFWGARHRIKDVQPAEFALLSRPDIMASIWIENNLDDDVRFLVNSFFAYEGSAVVGSDGGWWLPLTASRATTLPPLTYASEDSSQPNFREWTNELVAEVEEKGIENPGVLKVLADRGVTHVYIGQRQGRVNTSKPLLSIEQLLASPHYQLIYNKDRVWIFEISN